jgi:ribonuclease P protein component
MRRSSEFSAAVRGGVRVRRGAVVLHHRRDATLDPARIGIIVGRAVGNSVSRHRVSRRLRAQLSARLDQLPAGSATVVRALPEAAAAESARLGADIDAALRRLGETGPASALSPAERERP